MITQEKTLRGLGTAWEESLGYSDDEDLPTLFFLHGFPDTPFTYLEQWKYFKEYPIIAPWNRGVGKSLAPRNKKRYGLHGHLLDHLQILEEMDKRKKRKVVIIGHDIGSLYAWNLACHLKDRLQCLILINGVSPTQMMRRIFNPKQLMKSWYIGLFQVPYLAETIFKRYQKQIMEMAFKKGGKPPGEELSEFPMELAINQYRQAFYESLDHYSAEKSHFPFLSLWGKKDPFLELATEKELEFISDNFQIETVEGGHWVHQCNSKQVNQKMKDFIKQTSTL